MKATFRLDYYPNYFEEAVIGSKTAEYLAKAVEQIFDQKTEASIVYETLESDWGVLRVVDLSTEGNAVFLHMYDGIDFRVGYILQSVNDIQALRGLSDESGIPKKPSFVINKKPTHVSVWRGINGYINPSQMLEFEKMFRYQQSVASSVMLDNPVVSNNVVYCSLTYLELCFFLEACEKYCDYSALARSMCNELAVSAASEVDKDYACLISTIENVHEAILKAGVIVDSDSGLNAKFIKDGFQVKVHDYAVMRFVKIFEYGQIGWNVLVSEPKKFRDYLHVHDKPKVALVIREKVVAEYGWWQDIVLNLMTLAECIGEEYASA